MISKPKLITFKEFKEQLIDQDGFGKGMRIIYFEKADDFGRHKYRIAMVGRKSLCYKEAYRLLFLSTDETEREDYIQEGAFKFSISYNFSGAYYAYLPTSSL